MPGSLLPKTLANSLLFAGPAVRRCVLIWYCNGALSRMCASGSATVKPGSDQASGGSSAAVPRRFRHGASGWVPSGGFVARFRIWPRRRWSVAPHHRGPRPGLARFAASRRDRHAGRDDRLACAGAGRDAEALRAGKTHIRRTGGGLPRIGGTLQGLTMATENGNIRQDFIFAPENGAFYPDRAAASGFFVRDQKTRPG